MPRAFVLHIVFHLRYLCLGNAPESCWEGLEAANKIRDWALTVTETDTTDSEKSNIVFYETSLHLVKKNGDVNEPSYYLVAGGWQGAFYYEEGQPGEDRVGAYLYPDFFTSIVGVWQDHLLLRGKTTTLGEACQLIGGSWKLRFSEPSGPNLFYSPPSHYSLGAPDPLLPNPYESRTVEVRESSHEGAGEGLWATRDLLPGEVVAYYSGFIIHCESSLRALDRRELTDELEHERNMYNIALDIEGDQGQVEHNLCIDLPPDIGQGMNHYRATLGHKVNHSFEPNCEFVLLSSHPILGTVMGLAALKDIMKGEEISVNYGYNVTSDPDQPQWFIKLWNEYYGPSDNLSNIQKLEKDDDKEEL